MLARRIALAGAFALLFAVAGLLCSASPEKPPAEFIGFGEFSGGKLTSGVVLSGVRFGAHDDFRRMVLDFDELGTGGLRQGASAQPVYSVQYREFPYRLIVRLNGVRFDDNANVEEKDALPFSVIAQPDGLIKEIQVFLSGPSEFKVIEIDDPAKLALDVRRAATAIPTIYSVQLNGPANAAEAFALAEQSQFPTGFTPDVLVLGDVVVVEQPYAELSRAAEIDAALREMGYSSVISERRGNELPQR